MDEWGIGSYEETAAELAPAAEVAVGALELEPGESVLDVATGSGNAAAVAAAAGARVTGLDSSPRLVAVARERVPEAEIVEGDAGDMPFEDGAFDAAVSVFGVIFARPAERAVAELARVVRPGGRVAITSWPPRGTIFEVVGLMRRAVAQVRPPQGSPPVNWGDPDVVEGLLAPYGEVEITERVLPHYDVTPENVWGRWEGSHPMWIGAQRLLEPEAWARLRDASLARLREGFAAGDPATPYLLTLLRRD